MGGQFLNADEEIRHLKLRIAGLEEQLLRTGNEGVLKAGDIDPMRFWVAQNMDQGACVCDPAGNILWINRSFSEITGYALVEAQGKRIGDLLRGLETDPEQVALARSRSGLSKSYAVEVQFYTRDGKPFWAAVSGTVVLDAQGRPSHLIEFITDITAQKHAEREIKKLSLVATESNHAIVIRSPENITTWVNKAFEGMFGYSAAELIGKNITPMFLGPETDLEHLEATTRARMEGRKTEAELHVIRKDRTPIWVYLTTYPILDAQGTLESTVTIIMDVTEDKRREAELEMLSLVASKTVTGVVINDRSGHVVWVNDAFRKITGYGIEQVRNRLLGAILSGPETDAGKLGELREAIAAGRPYYGELLNYRSDGSPFWIAVSGTPVFNEQGERIREIEIINDITDRKTAECELVKTREEALQLSKAKETFLSVMSHEIRTPLNAILGITGVLMDETTDEQTLESLNLLKFSGENLRTLINDILDLTKIETGNLSLESVDVCLEDLLIRTVRTLEPRAAENSTRLVLESDEHLPALVKGDPVRIYQILMNLVGNAIRFTREGEVRVRVRAGEQSQSSVRVRISVSDTGIGIPEDRLESIFKPYTQASADTSRKYGGTGLGLAIVSNLLSLYGSTISVKSRVGVGTEFSFAIDFEKPAAGEPAVPLEGRRIMVVDDSEISLKVAAKLMAGLGAEVTVHEDTHAALADLKRKGFDAVLTDLHMPLMDGTELTRAIRGLDDPYFGELPVLALTGSSDPQELDAIKASGMNGYLVKPLSEAALVEAVLPLLAPKAVPGDGGSS